MPIAIKCPSCEASFRLADEMAGKRVKCQKCEHVFTVPKADAEEPPPAAKPKMPPMMVIDDEPEPQEAVTTTPKKPSPPKRAKDEDDEEDDEPRGKRRDRRGPRRDEPSKGKSGGGMSGAMMAVLGVVLFSCICCGGAGPAMYFMFDMKPAPIRPQPQPPIAVADGFGKDKGMPPPKFNDMGKPKLDGPMFDGFKDGPKFDGFKDVPVFDGFKDKFKLDGVKDQKPIPPANAIGVAFAPDGTYRSDNSLSQLDPKNQEFRAHKAYLVSLEGGVSYQFDMTSADFDSYLYIFSPANKLLMRDDDGGGFPNARMVFTPDQTVLYRVDAASFNGALGKFTLNIRRTAGVAKVDPPKLEPPKVSDGTIVMRTIKAGPFVVNELNLVAGPSSPLGSNEPCWDNDGKYLYWLQGPNVSVINKINQRTLKIEMNNILPQKCRQLVMSAEGLVTFSTGSNELWVLDPATLAIRKKISAPDTIGVTASPHTSTAFVLSSTNSVADLKAGTLQQLPIAKMPINFVGLRNPMLSPDGKYLFAQSNDATFHRLRFEAKQLVHEASKPAAVKTQFQWAFSPDSKQMAIVYPGPATKLKTTEIYSIDNWNTPIYSLPIRMRDLTFDGMGGIYAKTDKGDVHYYPNPAKQADVFHPWKTLGTVRGLFAPPQGPGAMVQTTTQSFWIEPVMK